MPVLGWIGCKSTWRDNIRFSRQNLRNALIGAQDPTFAGKERAAVQLKDSPPDIERLKKTWRDAIPGRRANLAFFQWGARVYGGDKNVQDTGLEPEKGMRRAIRNMRREKSRRRRAAAKVGDNDRPA